MKSQVFKDSNGKVFGYNLWLSATDTYNWAHRPGNSWPCSQLSGKRVWVQVDSNGLVDYTVNGALEDVDGVELDAIVADHQPKATLELWPVWEGIFKNNQNNS